MTALTYISAELDVRNLFLAVVTVVKLLQFAAFVEMEENKFAILQSQLRKHCFKQDLTLVPTAIIPPSFEKAHARAAFFRVLNVSSELA